MPVKRRVPKRRIDQYGKAHEFYLLRGCWLWEPFPFGEHADMDLARTCWDDIGPLLMAEWVGTRPGTRPWAWWQFDAPDERRRRPGPNGVGEWAETEDEFLDRHGLWWNGEREQLQHDAGGEAVPA